MIVVRPPAGGVPAAAVVLFHGGALRRGTPDDLRPHADALAAHGVLTACAGYRLLGSGATGIADCLADVVTATRRFATLAAEAGTPPDRVAVGGSSAGAHLALVAVVRRLVEVGAVVALNPAGCDLGRWPEADRTALEAEVGIDPGRLTDWSLVDLVRPGLPPVLIHHGTADEVEPVDDVRRFRDAVRAAGGECGLVEHPGAHHGFHHHPPATEAVAANVARFLRDPADPAAW